MILLSITLAFLSGSASAGEFTDSHDGKIRAYKTGVPRKCLAVEKLSKVHYQDAFVTDAVAPRENVDMYTLAQLLEEKMPNWIERIQRALFSPNAYGSSMAGATIMAVRDNEILLGNTHRDVSYRLSLFMIPVPNTQLVKVLGVTTVQYHNIWGRIRWGLVKNGHRKLAPWLLMRVAKGLR